jgi:hypothetical protein
MKDWRNSRSQSQESGWTLGWVSALDRNARTIWIADAHRDDGKRFVARADGKLTAFVELESMIRPSLREFPHSEFCRGSDRRWKHTAKIDRIKWIGGGNTDVFKT